MIRVRVGVASREHVYAAVRGGFCQLNHGKEAPLRRMNRDDKLIYYSPRTRMQGGEALHAFTAVGTITDDEPFQVRQAEGFHPFRRNTCYLKTKEAPIQVMLGDLTFTKGRSGWGMAIRRGVFEISHEDYNKIAKAMSLSEMGFGHS